MENKHDMIPDMMQKTTVPEDVHQRILNTCAALPAREAAKSKRLPLKITFSSIGSLAAAFLMLIGINAANPVFAEGLPLVGSMFKQYNGEKKLAVGSNIGTYEGVEEVSDVAAVSGEMELALKEVYSDGTYIHAAFFLKTPAELIGKFSYISMPALVTLNGEAISGPNNEKNYLNVDAREDGYAGTMAIKLPSPVENGTKLAFSYTINEAVGDDVMAADSVPEPLTCSFAGAYEITADTTGNETIGDFTGSGDVRVLSVVRTPSETVIEYQLPDWGEIGHAPFWGPRLFLADGTEMRRSLADDDMGCETSDGGKTFISTMHFDGLPQDADTIILRFGHEYNTFSSGGFVNGKWEDNVPKVMAELTVDLTNQSFTSTSTYLAAGMIDYSQLVYTDYTRLRWFLPYNDTVMKENYPGQRTMDEVYAIDELFQGDMGLYSMNIAKDGAVDMTLLKRGDDYKAVTLSLEKDGQTLAQVDSTEGDYFINSTLAHCHGNTEELYQALEDNQPRYDDSAEIDEAALQEDAARYAEDKEYLAESIAEQVPGQTYYGFRFNLNDGAAVNFMDTVTLTLKDQATGDVLYSKELNLTNKEIYDEG